MSNPEGLSSWRQMNVETGPAGTAQRHTLRALDVHFRTLTTPAIISPVRRVPAEKSRLERLNKRRRSGEQFIHAQEKRERNRKAQSSISRVRVPAGKSRMEMANKRRESGEQFIHAQEERERNRKAQSMSVDAAVLPSGEDPSTSAANVDLIDEVSVDAAVLPSDHHPSTSSANVDLIDEDIAMADITCSGEKLPCEAASSSQAGGLNQGGKKCEEIGKLEKTPVEKAPILSDAEAKSFLKSKRYLLSTPNVVSLEMSDEELDGKTTGGKILRVGVIKKQHEDNIKEPDIFIPKSFEHTKSNSNEVMRIPVKIVQEGELVLLGSSRDGVIPRNNAPFNGASLIQVNPLEIGCLGANIQYRNSYRLLSAAHVLTKFDRTYIGHEILVRNHEGNFVKIGATVTDQVDVVLYDSPEQKDRQIEFAKQDLAWADIAESNGSPEIERIGIPTGIRSARRGEYVKYCAGYSADLAEKVEVKNICADTRLSVKFPANEEKKFVFLEDVCRIKPEQSRLDNGDSGTAIVAEDDNALVGILIAKSDQSNSYFFCKLDFDEPT